MDSHTRGKHSSAPELCDVHMWKKTCVCNKRPIYTKRDLYIPKETYSSAPELNATYTCGKRRVYVTRDLYIPKETYVYQKRPTHNKRDLFTQKRHTLKRDLYMWKETYMCRKRPRKRIYANTRPHLELTYEETSYEVGVAL